MADDALTTDHFVTEPVIEEENKAPEQVKIEHEEKVLGDFSNTEGWQIIRGALLQQAENLRKGVGIDLSELDDAQVGQRVRASVTAASQIEAAVYVVDHHGQTAKK